MSIDEVIIHFTSLGYGNHFSRKLNDYTLHTMSMCSNTIFFASVNNNIIRYLESDIMFYNSLNLYNHINVDELQKIVRDKKINELC